MIDNISIKFLEGGSWVEFSIPMSPSIVTSFKEFGSRDSLNSFTRFKVNLGEARLENPLFKYMDLFTKLFDYDLNSSGGGATNLITINDKFLLSTAAFSAEGGVETIEFHGVSFDYILNGLEFPVSGTTTVSPTPADGRVRAVGGFVSAVGHSLSTHTAGGRLIGVTAVNSGATDNGGHSIRLGDSTYRVMKSYLNHDWSWSVVGVGLVCSTKNRTPAPTTPGRLDNYIPIVSDDWVHTLSYSSGVSNIGPQFVVNVDEMGGVSANPIVGRNATSTTANWLIKGGSAIYEPGDENSSSVYSAALGARPMSPNHVYKVLSTPRSAEPVVNNWYDIQTPLGWKRSQLDSYVLEYVKGAFTQRLSFGGARAIF